MLRKHLAPRTREPRTTTMPKEPPEFDCRSVRQVLRLRLKDWLWPLALGVAIAVPLLGRTDGPYRIGSPTYYIQTLGPLVWLGAIMFAGMRWAWVGRMRPRCGDSCARCGYSLDGLGARDPRTPCPECGAHGRAREVATVWSYARQSFAGLTLARALIDLPLLIALLFPLWILVALALMLLGVIDD